MLKYYDIKKARTTFTNPLENWKHITYLALKRSRARCADSRFFCFFRSRISSISWGLRLSAIWLKMVTALSSSGLTMISSLIGELGWLRSWCVFYKFLLVLDNSIVLLLKWMIFSDVFHSRSKPKYKNNCALCHLTCHHPTSTSRSPYLRSLGQL